MKKAINVLILGCVCLFLGGCANLGIFPEESNKKTVEGYLKADLSAGQVLDEWENRGWFNDGEAFVKMSVPDGFETDLGIVEIADGKFDDGWCAMPLTGTAYAYFYEWGGLFEHPETGERVIPEIEKGYWKMTGTAQNWEMVILDTDADILYYYEYDS
ncbi:MAG: hypothetical protein J6S04_01740 [Clostridia bacterium]|nr:hypothetical protein [Clostridia bacterium]